jgi:hypothetical protein
MARPDDRERRDELALTTQEAAIGIVAAVASAELGPVGAVVGALLAPMANLAAKRLREFVNSVHDSVDVDTMAKKLDDNEALAQLVAEAIRGTIESDLAAKRKLLARAAVRALTDDAAIDEEGLIVRTLNSVGTADVRLLAVLAGSNSKTMSEYQIGYHAPAVRRVLAPTISALEAAGLALYAPQAPDEPADEIEAAWAVTRWGDVVLGRLRKEGLDEELGE